MDGADDEGIFARRDGRVLAGWRRGRGGAGDSGTGRIGRAASDRRLALVERIQIDAKRSLVLVRRDGCEHLFVLLPDRVAVLETGIVRGAATPFGAMLETVTADA